MCACSFVCSVFIFNMISCQGKKYWYLGILYLNYVHSTDYQGTPEWCVHCLQHKDSLLEWEKSNQQNVTLYIPSWSLA